MSFNNKTIVITGGANGIGASCAEIFYKVGAKVCILDIDEQGQDFANKLGNNALFIACDVSKDDEVQSAIIRITNEVSDIDVLINNAGIQRYSTVTETSEAEWDLVMNVNLKSAFLCSKYVIPSMQKKDQGCIVNVASVQSFISQNNVAPYTTSKTALLGLTRSIAVDYGPQIRCVAVCPGTVDTPMLRNAIKESPKPEEVLQECHDMHVTKRIGTCQEVAEMIVYLAGDKDGFITGQAFRIDGGLGLSIGGSKRD